MMSVSPQSGRTSGTSRCWCTSSGRWSWSAVSSPARARSPTREATRLLRLGYWSLVALSLPGWLVMRIGAQWIYTKEGWDDLPEDAEPGWLGVGNVSADAGGLILAVSLIVGGIVYRLREGKGSACCARR